jgi:NitT/TauT family transport system substrate-binding protein
MLAHVGVDPRRDVHFVEYPAAEGKQLLAEGKVDAYLAFPPDAQELRDRKVGHVLVSGAVDRPWSQYFCCFPRVIGSSSANIQSRRSGRCGRS